MQAQLAAREGRGFFDTVEAMGGPLSMLRWRRSDPPLGRGDLTHLTPAGYQRLGDMIVEALLRGFPRAGARAR